MASSRWCKQRPEGWAYNFLLVGSDNDGTKLLMNSCSVSRRNAHAGHFLLFRHSTVGTGNRSSPAETAPIGCLTQRTHSTERWNRYAVWSSGHNFDVAVARARIS